MDNINMPLKDQVILVTGAGGGLGSTAAIALARQGAHIILLDKSIPKLEKVYDAIVEAKGTEPTLYPFDLAGASEVQYEALATTLHSTYGSIQGLLHSAVELSAFTPIEQHETKDWGHTLNVNLNAVFLLTRVLLPVLQKSEHASIVFTGDSMVRTPKAYSGAYGVSKIAIEGFAKILAQELESSQKIRVNTLLPGPVNSPLRQKLFPAEDKNKLPSMDSLQTVYTYLFGSESIGTTGQTIDAQTFNQ
jgi:NAD(P)-dependent dehydrogenase (short-subunit alcohol dehydrogenase family)